jgi:glycosyltransferase involved in cell wall biosynthesis
MEIPFFTIIIPTYNRARNLKIPIKSILNQSFTSWELIIIDDGSTDDTKSIIGSFSRSNIHYFYRNHEGKSAARNYGITKAKGQYICFQDSDDEYLPEHLNILYEYIQNNPLVKLVRTGLLLYENNQLVKKSAHSYHKWNNTYPFENFTTAAIHCQLLKEVSFPEHYFIYEDLHFLLQLSRLTPCHVIPAWTAIYHYNPKNSGGIGPNYEKNMLNKRACLDDILSWHYSDFRSFIIKKRCLTEILLLVGHMQQQPKKIFESLVQNIKTFSRFPLEYSYLCFRIIYVTLGEWTGLYQTKDRF